MKSFRFIRSGPLYAIENNERHEGKKTFLLFICLTIRTIHRSFVFELNALKLHHERIARLFAIHIFHQ